jgi:hypothetical protein
MSIVLFVRNAAGDDQLEPLAAELSARGARLEILRQGCLGLDAASTASVSAMLARHGVIVVTACALPEGWPDDVPSRQIDAADLADPKKLQKLLRTLELKGLIPPPETDVSPEEEALIRERLERLGYL